MAILGGYLYGLHMLYYGKFGIRIDIYHKHLFEIAIIEKWVRYIHCMRNNKYESLVGRFPLNSMIGTASI